MAKKHIVALMAPQLNLRLIRDRERERETCRCLKQNKIPTAVKEGDTVLLPEYGGTQVKLGEKSYLLLCRIYSVGKLRPFLPKKFPYIPGTDVAGEVVVEVGPGVQNFKPGDRVISSLSHAEAVWQNMQLPKQI